MNFYKLLTENKETTVVAEYEFPTEREHSYQSEAQLEKEFIEQLQKQSYEYLPICTEKALIQNLRTQLEKLNSYTFSNAEWEQFFTTVLANNNNGIVEKTKMIQEDHIQILHCDDGTKKNIYLIDKENIHNNTLQVINQYATEEGKRSNRYDVSILVNGLPLVHVELKRRGVHIKEAFNQINRYSKESFWAGNGLYEYIQIFIISNGTHTKYYSNTTRNMSIKENNNNANTTKKSSNSFEFTSWWTDANNTHIEDCIDFAKTFLAKHSILHILTKYCVFNTEHNLLVMRPYQIVATERILAKIAMATNCKHYGSIEAGGYIWHTTGSGKTLTSFKTAQLASKMEGIQKVLFIVDRKDLDHQTMKEYEKFEKGAANGNTNTKKLQKQLEDPNTRIIVTTIQKLSIFINKNKKHSIYEQPIVLIFDECHRSQFGDMHKAIIRAFTKYYLFGFTGTPIFAQNIGNSSNPLETTEQVFGSKLHAYTLADATIDNNVLHFLVDYISTMKEAEDITDKKVQNIDKEKALGAPERITNIVQYILEHFDAKTMRNSFYSVKKQRLAGFNALFAVSSIDMAKKYYAEFQKQMKELPSDKKLKVATIYSFAVNEDEPEIVGIIEDENLEDTTKLDKSSRDFLEHAIQDYNRMFSMNYNTSSEKFQSYYQDVSKRMKNRDLDLLIIVNMFLTGFDAPTLNTLWVDKNLHSHGLLQAYSRTNRILNSVKAFGNIVCFRNLRQATDEALALFGNKDAKGIVLLRSYEDYYNGYHDDRGVYHKGYKELLEELQNTYPIGTPIIGEAMQKDFITLYNTILKVKNILSSMDDKFTGNEIFTEREFQDYQSIYIDMYQEFSKKETAENEYINDDIVFEMELIKQVQYTIDYILELIAKYQAEHKEDKEIIITLNKYIDSTVDLRNKKELIQQFVESLNAESIVHEDWVTFVEQAKLKDLDAIIAEENLKSDATYTFIDKAFRDGYIQGIGMAMNSILPPVSRFDPNEEKLKKRNSVLEKLSDFFYKYQGISNNKL
ncbi:MAG: type I restriction endonuclease subunit R [Desulfovibrionaceae bacterium]